MAMSESVWRFNTSLIDGNSLLLALPPDDPPEPQAANATSMMAKAMQRITSRR
jgi:hypothetical protein